MPKIILTVDDSATVRETVKLSLSGRGYDILIAADGAQGLSRCQECQVDLVITDLNMPVMDGITLIERLRSIPTYRFVPILMLTTESQDARKQEGKRAGATGWIVKPFDPSKLLAVVQKVCPA